MVIYSDKRILINSKKEQNADESKIVQESLGTYEVLRWGHNTYKVPTICFKLPGILGWTKLKDTDTNQSRGCDSLEKGTGTFLAGSGLRLEGV